MSEKDLVKVKCPACSKTWWTNIYTQKCMETMCPQLVDKSLHSVK